MRYFDVPVQVYMTKEVRSVGEGADLEEIWTVMQEHRLSSIPVLDDGGHMVGVVSRIDLLRTGTLHFAANRKQPALELPRRAASEVMHSPVTSVGPDTTVTQAASTMVEKRVHRVFVEVDGRPVGVLSTRDVMQCVVDRNLTDPVSALMTSPVMTVRVTDTLAAATNALLRARVTGLVAEDNGWPAGVFTQREALEARDRDPDTPVEEVMGYSLVTMPPETPVHRAAAHAVSTRARRIVVFDDKAIRGILSSLDLARIAAKH